MQQENSDGLETLIAVARQCDSEALGELLLRYRKYLVFLARSQMHRHIQALALKALPLQMALAEAMVLPAEAGEEEAWIAAAQAMA